MRDLKARAVELGSSVTIPVNPCNWTMQELQNHHSEMIARAPAKSRLTNLAFKNNLEYREEQLEQRVVFTKDVPPQVLNECPLLWRAQAKNYNAPSIPLLAHELHKAIKVIGNIKGRRSVSIEGGTNYSASLLNFCSKNTSSVKRKFDLLAGLSLNVCRGLATLHYQEGDTVLASFRLNSATYSLLVLIKRMWDELLVNFIAVHCVDAVQPAHFRNEGEAMVVAFPYGCLTLYPIQVSVMDGDTLHYKDMSCLPTRPAVTPARLNLARSMISVWNGHELSMDLEGKLGNAIASLAYMHSLAPFESLDMALPGTQEVLDAMDTDSKCWVRPLEASSKETFLEVTHGYDVWQDDICGEKVVARYQDLEFAVSFEASNRPDAVAMRLSMVAV